MLTKIKKLTVILTLAVLFFPTLALADEFDAQINALKSQISQNQAAANQKAAEANTLKNKVSQLQSQINAAQAAVNLTKAEIAQTEAQITAANAEMDKQKIQLKDNVRLAQQQSDVSSLEILVSSESLSDYVNKQEFLKNIMAKIDESMQKIETLKKELTEKNNQLSIQRSQQQAQLNAVAAQQQEQNNLLAQTKGEEAAYQTIVADTNKQLQGIYAERARRDAANGVGVSTGGTGGYPYSNDSYYEIDQWGFYKRECVSYVAWKRRAVGKQPYPYFWGNAGNWDNYASWDYTPTPGAIAVFDPGVQSAGSIGHVAYVESVNGNTINLSEYNWQPHVYTYRTSVPYSGIKFIH